MSLESILVRMLNRPRQTRPERVNGFRLGRSENLLCGTNEEFSLPWRPVQHTFISGRTGTGKTTLLLLAMAEHSSAGMPFLFIDFHGHATESLLAVQGARKLERKIILFEPWSDPVVGWNPLESGDESP